MRWPNNIFRFLLLLPFFGWTYQIFWGDLGAQPAQELNHQTGLTALVYLVANLWIGILFALVIRSGKKWPTSLRFLILERRYLGILNYIILFAHIFLYFALEAFESKALTQVLEKRYLQFGSLAFIGMTLLAITSNNFSVRKLGGKKWKNLHRLVYLIAFLVMGHIFLIEKADLALFAIMTLPMWAGQLVRLILFGKNYFLRPSF